MSDPAKARKPQSARGRLRRYLPTPETARASRALRWLGPLLDRPWLWHLNRRSVALGVAVGLFFGLLIPVAQVLFAGAAALVVRANLPVAVVSTLISNPLTFAPIYLLAYQLGAALLGQPADTDPTSAVADATVAGLPFFERAIEWLGEIGRPLIVGLTIVAVAGATLGYVAVHGGWRLAVAMRMRSRHRNRGSSVARA